jgi:cytochrome c oxidase subunit 2
VPLTASLAIVVDVVSKADYKKWVSKQQAAAAAAVASANETW